MLRMYYCNWCWSQQVHDDDKSFLKPDGERMLFHMRFKCENEDCAWNRDHHPMMHPMIKNRDEDWVPQWRSNIKKTKENMEVIAPIMWH